MTALTLDRILSALAAHRAGTISDEKLEEVLGTVAPEMILLNAKAAL